METVLIFVETKGEEIKKASLEVLSEGTRLAETGRFAVEAAVLGPVSPNLENAIALYADRVVHIADPLLDSYTPEGYAMALADYARIAGPKMILAGATQTARDFLPRVAVLLECGIASDVTAARWLDEPITVVRPVYGGKVLTEVSCDGSPFIVLTRPNTFDITPPVRKAGEVVERPASLPPGSVKTRLLKKEEKPRGKVDLTEADAIVSGGRGLKAAENFAILEELAGVIGGAVGATRSVVDAKWRVQEDQVGKSGRTVSPKLYIAAGISGAIHHIMGMDTSKTVLAINKDPNAIIFNYATYGIVGDLFEIIPAMTAELKKRLGTSEEGSGGS
ncbi:MAG TPA: electron transfer flavoprotein subunit alpha/FixB family protein [Syntrophorhabdales bacterium]|nr:electron transfer flavoprotein subunit alpha/FixB family protein [Syntrophorhabdales bacterium]